jgi:hypothetical protein
MRFSLLSFIGLTSAAAVTSQAADYGSWAVTLSISSAANGFQSRDLTAVYSSTDLAEPVTVTCAYKNVPGDASQNTDGCDDASFSYYYFGSSKFECLLDEHPIDVGFVGIGERYANDLLAVGITQTVQLWGENVTVSGEQELTQSCGGSGRSCTIEGTVLVSTAVA